VIPADQATAEMPVAPYEAMIMELQSELAALEQLDGILHPHHSEVTAAARDAVVNGVADDLLGLPGQGRGYRRRDR
jgi:hypothetical protein